MVRWVVRSILHEVDLLSSFSFQPVLHEREREMFYLTTHSTHFIYGYMASDIWLRTILIVRKETRCRHIGYSYRLTARVLLYAPSHRQDNTYHSLCYTSRGALAGTRFKKKEKSVVCQIKNTKSKIYKHKSTAQELGLSLGKHKPTAQ